MKADADTMGWGEGSQPWVPTAMAVAPGTMVLGMRLDTLRGRRPLDRLAEVCAPPDTAVLLGQAVAPATLHDDTVGRGLERLDEGGTMQRCPACAGRAEQGVRWDKRSGHCATTAVSV